VIPAADLEGAAVLSTAFFAVIAAAELWRRLGDPRPEWTRKLVHLGGGGACLLFPFLVDSPWVVLVLALAMSGIFAVAGRLGVLCSLHGVSRPSRGAEYYPLAIFLVFLMTRDRAWLYVSAVLTLAVGDAFAALIGSRYGVVRYRVEEDHKSLEGSLVFLVITFLAIHLPMLLMTELPRPVCVLAAALVAVLATGFEAISLKGADNLFVPLAVVVILSKITVKPLAEVVFQNLSLVSICLVVALIVWRVPMFNVGAAVAVILYAYANWSLGSWQWALPVFAGLACYLVARTQIGPPRPAHQVRVRAVARAVLPPLVLLILANSTSGYATFFAPYLAASATALALTLDHPELREVVTGAGLGGARTLVTAVAGWAAAAVPPWLVQAEAPALPMLVMLPLTVALAGLGRVLECRPSSTTAAQWTAARFLLTAAAGGLVLAAQVLGLLQPWAPLG